MKTYKNSSRKFCSKFGFKMNNIIYAAFLAMLMKKPLYGYLLVEGLDDFGVESNFVPYGAAYRILRNMEAEGFVTSEWETEGNGPARRVYSITPAGEDYLKHWAESAKKNLLGVRKLINMVDEELNKKDKNSGGEK